MSGCLTVGAPGRRCLLGLTGAGAIALGLCAEALGGQSTVDRAPRRTGGPTRGRGWGDRLPEQGPKAFPSRGPVPRLGAELGGHDCEHGAHQSRPQPMQDALTLCLVEDRGCGDVEGQPDPRVRRVHPLAARAGRVRVALDQLVVGDDQTRRQPRRRSNPQLAHRPTVGRSTGRRGDDPANHAETAVQVQSPFAGASPLTRCGQAPASVARGSEDAVAAVDGQHRAGHEARRIAGQEHDGRAELVRLPGTLLRGVLDPVPLELRLVDG